MGRHVKTTEDSARDELLAQIHRCGVLDAAADKQEHWLRDTLEYLEQKFPDLSDRQLHALREVGERFCQPVIPHGKGHSALTREQWQDSEAT